MSLAKNAQAAHKPNLRSTVDTMLLSTLVNKELGADGRVFNIKIEYFPSNDVWQLWVEHFKGTHMQVYPETLTKQGDMIKLAKDVCQKLLDSMTQKFNPPAKEPKNRETKETK